jgi:hypothetical protein
LKSPNSRVDTFPIRTEFDVRPVVSVKADDGIEAGDDFDESVEPDVVVGADEFVDEQAATVSASTATASVAVKRGALGRPLRLSLLCICSPPYS